MAPLGSPFANANWDRSVTTESFNSGLVWKADAEDTVRLTVGRGVQLPNLAELGALVFNSPLANYTGVPTLQPTVVTNYELGWDHYFEALNAHFRASGFHQTTNEIASLTGGFLVAPSGAFFTSANVARSHAEGIELAVKGKLLTDWRWGISYTPEVVTDHFNPGLTNLSTNVDFQHTNPVHVVNANLGWSNGPWEIDGFLRYESSFLGFLPAVAGQFTTLGLINDYVSIDTRIAYQLTDRITLALSGQNITQATQRQTSGPNVERRIFGTITVKF